MNKYLSVLLLLIALAAGAPDEAYGRVVKVVDGDTFDVALQDSQLSEDLIRVRLADIDTPGDSRLQNLRSRKEGISIYPSMVVKHLYLPGSG